MINNISVVSLYQKSPPQAEGEDGRNIDSGPLYSTETVSDLARQSKVIPWSNGAIKDAQKWGLSNVDLGGLIQDAVLHGKYHGSQWCLKKPGGPWSACDVYVITVAEWIYATQTSARTTYYLKFAIGKSGQILLSASNHPEGT